MVIFREDLATLNAKNYINDNIIDFMLKYKHANNIVLTILNVHLLHQIEFPSTRKTIDGRLRILRSLGQKKAHNKSYLKVNDQCIHASQIQIIQELYVKSTNE